MVSRVDSGRGEDHTHGTPGGLRTTYRLIDVFAGCGGMTRGFIDSGRFESRFAVEMDKDAAETFRRNFGDHVLAERIQDVPAWPQSHVLIGGPPCQGFSPLNRNGVGPERRALWRHYLIALRESGAHAFVMENVPQLLRSPEYQAFRVHAKRLGFHIAEDVLLAADYGVPQLRRRAIVVGVRGHQPVLPAPTHRDPKSHDDGRPPWRTFRWATDNPTPLSLKPDRERWHRPRNPTETSLERYRTIPDEGEGRFELAKRRPDITPACWLNKTTGTTDVFGRLWWERPAYTIRTEFYKPEKGRYLHPSEHRPITVREAARCMSFPDDFELPEDQSMTSVARQVGNAVPCLLAQRIAESLAVDLDIALGDDAHTDVRLLPHRPQLELVSGAA
jgi:DNA (cytosine-5)-methyltransferase 1